MDKPLSMRIIELQEGIAQLINESGIPPVFVRYLMKDIDTALARAQREQEARERKEWEEAQGKELDDLIDRIEVEGE